jgi:hypothetical protein
VNTTPRAVRDLKPGDVLTLGEGHTVGVVVHVRPGADGYPPGTDVWTLRAVAVNGYVSDTPWPGNAVWSVAPPPDTAH